VEEREALLFAGAADGGAERRGNREQNNGDRFRSGR
jgi:hypothetical protein